MSGMESPEYPTHFLLPGAEEMSSRRASNAVLLIVAVAPALLGALFLAVLFTSSVDATSFVVVVSIAAILFGVSALLALRRWRASAELATELEVRPEGFALSYESRHRRVVVWGREGGTIRVIDAHESYPGSLSRRLVIGRSATPITEIAQLAILASARSAGALVREGPAGSPWGSMTTYDLRGTIQEARAVTPN